MVQKVGEEFLVNTTTDNDQGVPSVTGLSDGGFVVTWTDNSQTGGDQSGNAIRGQVYNTDGSARGGEFLVNTTTDGSQFAPSVTGLSDGGFVVTWHDSSGIGGDQSSTAIRGQVYNADGSAQGGEFLVNTTTDGAQSEPSLTGLSDGSFVVTWVDRSQTGGDDSLQAIVGQVYNADGSAQGGEFLVNTTTFFNQYDPSVTGLSDGGFVVTWEDNSQTGGDQSASAIRGQAYNADGSAQGGEFLVNTTTTSWQSFPSVTDLSDGGFVVTWEDSSETGDDQSGEAIRAQIFDGVGNGTPTKTITGTVAGENLDGGVDAEVIKGLDGDDVVRGAGGNDHVYGNKDADQVYGNKGDDLVFGGQGADVVFGGQDDDQVYGNVGNDQVYGNLGVDLLFGGQGSDDLFGGAGADQIYGNRDDDRIYGNKGDDTLFGGGGNDEFSFFDGDGHDTVGDFAGGDTLAIKSGINSTGIENFSDLEVTNNDNGDAVIDLGDEASVTITGISAGELAASDFNFF